ncbi:MAG: hypothetical protein JYX80_01850 [Candidatus Scalindua sediminis]|nr:hypothetical protein [Candidatus Scalindua sediminis]
MKYIVVPIAIIFIMVIAICFFCEFDLIMVLYISTLTLATMIAIILTIRDIGKG